MVCVMMWALVQNGGGKSRALEKLKKILAGAEILAAGGPLPQVQVAIVNTMLGAQTDEQGKATIRNVAPGGQQVRAIRMSAKSPREAARQISEYTNSLKGVVA